MRNEFSHSEDKEISKLLTRLREVGRDGQKQIRSKLRRSYKFYISSFTKKKGFSVKDYQDLKKDGTIKIV